MTVNGSSHRLECFRRFGGVGREREEETQCGPRAATLRGRGAEPDNPTPMGLSADRSAERRIATGASAPGTGSSRDRPGGSGSPECLKHRRARVAPQTDRCRIRPLGTQRYGDVVRSRLRSMARAPARARQARRARTTQSTHASGRYTIGAALTYVRATLTASLDEIDEPALTIRSTTKNITLPLDR